jgi:class 3 adenylate cyclase
MLAPKLRFSSKAATKELCSTIGDSYMVGAGIPASLAGHANKLLDYAIDMLKATHNYNQIYCKNISIRIGINSGPAVAGVIGTKKILYDLWGDTVNTASRMESTGVADRIQVTANTYRLTKDQFDFEERGAIEVKGKGKMLTYFLIGKKN